MSEQSNARKTHCPQGHEYSKENTHVDKTGRRHCRKCDADKTRERSRQRYANDPAWRAKKLQQCREYRARKATS